MPKCGLTLIHIFPYTDRIVFVCSRIWTESYPYFPVYGQAESYPYFPVFGQNLQFCPNT